MWSSYRTLVLGGFGFVFCFLSVPVESSNGTKPIAHDIESLGRGGTAFAPQSNPTAMLNNPANLSFIGATRLGLDPVALFIDSKYSDPENPSSRSETDFVPYANSVLGFPLQRSNEEKKDIHEQDMIRNWSYYYYGSRTRDFEPDSFICVISPDSKVVRTANKLAIDVYGDCTILSIEVVSKGKMTEISRQVQAPFKMEVPQNLLPAESARVTVLAKRSAASGVKFVSDTMTFSREVSSENYSPRSGEGAPPPDFETLVEESPVSFYFGIGEAVQSGAGADQKIKTKLYPEGTRYFSAFSFVSVTPTLSVSFNDSFSFGVSLLANIESLDLEMPITQSPLIMKGNIFPTNTLTVDTLPGISLPGNIDVQSVNMETMGLSNVFGEALKSVFGTSPVHLPGTSITHSDRGYHPDYGEITGRSKITDASALGFSPKVGFSWKINEWLGWGLSWQYRTLQPNMKGKATVDFSRQINHFTNDLGNTTVAHSNEVLLSQAINIPDFIVQLFGLQNTTVESQFSFNDVWANGVVDLIIRNVPLFGTITLNDVQLLEGSILSQLPNQGLGADGVPNTGDEWLAHYDVEIQSFNMPGELGTGFSIRPTNRLNLLFDVKRIFWSAAMDDFKVKLKNGDNADINKMVGSSEIEVSVPLKWKDQTVYGIGTEYLLFDWLILRTGFNYGSNPIPSKTILPVMPAVTEKHFTLGFSIFAGSFKFDVAWVRAYQKQVKITQSDNGSDLENAVISVSQDIWALGVTITF